MSESLTIFWGSLIICLGFLCFYQKANQSILTTIVTYYDASIHPRDCQETVLKIGDHRIDQRYTGYYVNLHYRLLISESNGRSQKVYYSGEKSSKVFRSYPEAEVYAKNMKNKEATVYYDSNDPTRHSFYRYNVNSSWLIAAGVSGLFGLIALIIDKF